MTVINWETWSPHIDKWSTIINLVAGVFIKNKKLVGKLHESNEINSATQWRSTKLVRSSLNREHGYSIRNWWPKIWTIMERTLIEWQFLVLTKHQEHKVGPMERPKDAKCLKDAARVCETKDEIWKDELRKGTKPQKQMHTSRTTCKRYEFIWDFIGEFHLLGSS